MSEARSAGTRVSWQLLIAIGAAGVALTGLVFGAGWLRDASADVRDTFHMLGSLAVGVVGVALVGWLIIRRSPSLLAAAPSLQDFLGAARRDEQRANYARWFILMRWIAVLTAVTLIVISVPIARLLPREVLWPLLASAGGLGLLNCVWIVFLRRDAPIQRLLELQVYGDLVALVFLLHFSGGIENPLFLLTFLHVIIAGVVLSRRKCYAVAGIASFLVTLLAVAECTHTIGHYGLQVFPHYKIGHEEMHASHSVLYVASSSSLHAGLLFLVAYFVTGLADRLRHDERQLERLAIDALERRQVLERALETAHMGVRVLSRNREQRWANSRWLEWLSAHPPETVRADGSLERGHVRVSTVTTGQDKEERLFQVTTAPLLDGEGALHQIVEFAQDITEQTKLQARMIRAGQLAAVGELAGQVAHEVNNPIAIISAKARLLLSDERAALSERPVSELGKIVELADRVAHIAKGLLSYCRPSGASRAHIDVGSAVRHALAMAEQRARSPAIVIEDRMPAGLPKVRANMQEMEQVFLNLILNGLDSIGESGRVTATARAGVEEVEIEIEDTGHGIPPHDLERVFEPFYTTKRSGRGTGLGLAICQGIVGSHGGDIDVFSEVGRGTRFVVRLPIDDSKGVAHG